MTNSKRVGTLSLGIALCYIGITLVLSLFVNLNIILLMMRLFPLVLVCLGIETILFAAGNREGHQLKYDGISIFLIVLFCIGSLGVSALGWGISVYQSAAGQNEWYQFFNQAFRWNPSASVSALLNTTQGFAA